MIGRRPELNSNGERQIITNFPEKKEIINKELWSIVNGAKKLRTRRKGVSYLGKLP